MKHLLIALGLMLGLLSVGMAQAPQGAGARDITFALVGYELPRKDAAALLLMLEAKVDAQAMIQLATRAHSNPAKLGTLKTPSGVRASMKQGGVALELEATLGADGRTISTVLALEESRAKITTALTLADGVVAFLGTLEQPARDAVKLVFIRAAVSPGGP